MAKVAILIGQLAYVGGVGIAAVNEVRELRKLGVEAELVVLFRRNEFEWVKTFGTEDIPVIFLSDRLPKFLRINFKIPGFSFFSFFHISSIFWAPLVIKKLNYDVILAHETYNCFSAIACAKLLKIKLLTYFWDPVSYIVPRVYKEKIPSFLFSLVVFISKSIDRFIIKNSDLVILGSGLHEKLVRDVFSSQNIVKIPAGTRVLKNVDFDRESLVVALTKWDKGKNPEFLLEIAKGLKGQFKFIIAGNWTDQKQKEEFEQKIGKMRLAEKVFVVGKVTEEEKYKLFSKAKVLVHPIVEAFGMMALEAAGCGCPFILPDNSGVNELFTEGKHAYFPDEGDVNAFVKYINIFLTDEKKALSMGHEAWKNAHNYTWEVHAKKILNSLFNRFPEFNQKRSAEEKV